MTVAYGVDKHVAVLAFPFGSHAAPLLSLVRKIAVEVPEVTFSFFSTSKSNASVFSGQEHHNIKPYDVSEGLPEDYVPSGHPLEATFLFIKAMPENYRLAMDEVVAKTGKKFTCLVTDAFYWFGAEMAEEMNAKWVPLWTAGPHAVFAHVVTELIKETIGCDDEVKAEEVVKNIDEPFSNMVHKMGQMLPKATAVAINSFAMVHPLIGSELESMFQSLLNVGPFILTTPQPAISDEQGCLEWLDKQEKASVVYISFGRLVTPPPHEIIALAEALEESGFPFIWAFRGNPEKQLPEGFLERTRARGKIVSWAPQMEILKHPSVGVCLTHGGWNSCLDCIVGGVPMIGRPFFGDQSLNTRMMESTWGIGVANKVLTKESILKSLELTMAGKTGEIMRQKVLELKGFALKAVEPDGNSTRDFSTLIQIVTS